MSRPPSYKTIASPGSSNHDYHDRDSLPFDAKYPLIEFTEEKIKIGDSPAILHKQLLSNYWFQKANVLERKEMLKRLEHINKNFAIVIDFIKKNYVSLGFEIEHVSLAGSYLHAAEPGDIDFNVVLSGSYFDYVTFNDGIDLLDQTASVRKISLTIMGIENVLGKQFTHDDIRNDGFVHHDTIIREMLVAPMRNVTVFGRTFDNTKNIDSRNVLVRVARQLYFAELTLEGKIPYYEQEPLRSRKAIKRIREAYEIIDWLLNRADDLKK